MAETILVFILIAALITFLIFVSLRETKFSRRKIFLIATVFTVFIIGIVISRGIDKITLDISKVISQSSPKEPLVVYSLLLKKPKNNCVEIINFKDQIIPQIDCCIWMEVRTCSEELNRILSLKNYSKSKLKKSDSTIFLLPFNNKPLWWSPQILGDSLTKYSIRINQEKEQTIFVGDDSSHIFLCDRAM